MTANVQLVFLFSPVYAVVKRTFVLVFHNSQSTCLKININCLPRVCAKFWDNIPRDIKQLSFAKFEIAYKNLLLETYMST